MTFNILSHYYPKKEIYLLAHQFGRRLSDFLGEIIFSLFLDSHILILGRPLKKRIHISDESYKLLPAAKGLEGFLYKVIKGKKLNKNKDYSIGAIFGKEDQLVRKKIKNKKLIARTKSVWDFCRNDVVHYSSNPIKFTNLYKRYDEILEIIELLFQDFYGKTEPDKEIKKCFDKYCLPKEFKKELKLLRMKPDKKYTSKKKKTKAIKGLKK